MSARSLALVVALAAVTVLSMGVGTIAAHPVVSAVSAPATGGISAPSTSNPTGLAVEQRVLASAKADHTPMEAVSLPNLLGQTKITNGVVSPLVKYAPAPMGIGTFGVLNTTGVATPYSLLSTSWEGTVNLSSDNDFLLANDGALSASGTNNNTFGAQLNVVTVNTTVGAADNYSYWLQNVAYYNFPAPGYITFLDNIWNFSSPAIFLPPSSIYSGNGAVQPGGYYYTFSAPLAAAVPATVHLFINSTTTHDLTTAWDTFNFSYQIVNPVNGHTLYGGTYDTVRFNSSLAHVNTSPFLVSGSQVTPTNFLLYDAEIMIGGPGGGTTTSFYGISGSESLQYWDGTAYVNPPSAWDVGTDTGETSEGIAETYSTPGTVQLSAGPSFPMPFWNATPGGNVGSGTFSGPLSPTNAFVFFTPGSVFNTSFAAWAPTQTSPVVTYSLPPGTYTIDAMLSDYRPIQVTATVTNGGAVPLHFVLTRDTGTGVYTPLFAWNNGQLATISQSGSGTALAPYTLDNNPAKTGLNPVFGEFNDYLYQVFPAVLLVGTTAHVDITGHASAFDVFYPAIYHATLMHLDLPLVNEQQIELFNTTHVAIWQLKDISGWFFFEDYGPTGFLPLANVVLFQSSGDLVGHSSFLSQGSALLLADIFPGATGNIVWGNTFVNSSLLSPTMYPGNGHVNGPPVGIFAFEAGDLIYNNYIATTIEAYSQEANFFTGAPQLNLENWNLSAPEPKSFTVTLDGEKMKGTIIPSGAEGGNYWADYTGAAGLPFNFFGYIGAGGDYFPLPLFKVTFTLTEKGAPVTWFVNFSYDATNGFFLNQSTSGHTIVVYASVGTYPWFANVTVGGGYIAPASGSVTVLNGPVHVALKHK